MQPLLQPGNLPVGMLKQSVCACRYAAEIGDVVVGRVLEVSKLSSHKVMPSCALQGSSHLQGQVAGKRWRIDLKSRQEAALMLSAVNLPGGIQVSSLQGGDSIMICHQQEPQSNSPPHPFPSPWQHSCCLLSFLGGSQASSLLAGGPIISFNERPHLFCPVPRGQPKPVPSLSEMEQHRCCVPDGS